MAATKPPAGLGEAGRALWRSISDPVKAWQLNPAEKAVLAHACRVQDILDDLHKQYADLPDAISTGYMGQDVEHPVVTAIAKYTALLGRLITSLKLPDLQSGATPAATKARKAAQTRWSKPRAS